MLLIFLNFCDVFICFICLYGAFLAVKQQIPIDYLIVNIDSWEEHLTHWNETFSRLLLANLIVNLGDICLVTIDY